MMPRGISSGFDIPPGGSLRVSPLPSTKAMRALGFRHALVNGWLEEVSLFFAGLFLLGLAQLTLKPGNGTEGLFFLIDKID